MLRLETAKSLIESIGGFIHSQFDWNITMLFWSAYAPSFCFEERPRRGAPCSGSVRVLMYREVQRGDANACIEHSEWQVRQRDGIYRRNCDNQVSIMCIILWAGFNIHRSTRKLGSRRIKSEFSSGTSLTNLINHTRLPTTYKLSSVSYGGQIANRRHHCFACEI